MRIQLVNTYLKMMDEGLLPYIRCGSDEEHTRPFVRLLEDDSLELYCLAGDWTRQIGIQEYDTYRTLLSLYNLDWKDSE
jgi:hypothetical protein